MTGNAVSSALLATVESDRLATLEAQRPPLVTELAEARARATAVSQRLASAEEAWARAEQHTLTDAELLQTLRDELPKLTARVTEAEQRLSDVDGEMATLYHHGERARVLAREQEVWPPVCRALVKPVRELIPALKALRAAWDLRYAERAAGNVDRATELALYGAGFSDDLLPELERWLAAVGRAGYLDSKAK